MASSRRPGAASAASATQRRLRSSTARPIAAIRGAGESGARGPRGARSGGQGLAFRDRVARVAAATANARRWASYEGRKLVERRCHNWSRVDNPRKACALAYSLLKCPQGRPKVAKIGTMEHGKVNKVQHLLGLCPCSLTTLGVVYGRPKQLHTSTLWGLGTICTASVYQKTCARCRWPP